MAQIRFFTCQDGYTCSEAISVRDDARYYYGSLVHASLIWCQHTAMMCARDVLEVTRATFPKWIKRMYVSKVSKSSAERKAWVVIASFIATIFIIDKRYLPGNQTLREDCVQPVRPDVVVINQRRSLDGASDFQSHFIFGIWGLRNITVGERL